MPQFVNPYATPDIAGGGGSRLWRPLHPPELKQTELLKSPFHLKKHSVKAYVLEVAQEV